MGYQSYKPCPLLEPFVERYYVLEGDAAAGAASLSVPACPTAALVFSYADPVVQRLAGGTDEVLPNSFIVGPALSGSALRLGARTGVVGVVLKSAGFLRFMGVSASDVLGRRVDLELVVGPEVREEGERLREARGPRARVASVEAYLLRRLGRHGDGAPDWLDDVAGVLVSQRGRVLIDGLAGDFGISGRHLRRRFTERAGVGPKLFARLKRFGYANVLLSQHPRLDAQDVVFMAGFYDQAHLIKEFKAFRGLTPSAVRRVSATSDDRQRSAFNNPQFGASP